MAVVARRSCPTEKRRVLIRRKDILETVKGLLFASSPEWVVVGASRSLNVPVKSLASVEVSATMDT